MTNPVEMGNAIFFGKAFCNQCHFGQNLTDNQFHNLGIGWDEQSESFTDVGRAAISSEPADIGAFKTPTLRDVARRAPYMHDGSIGTLREVIEHYSKGGVPNPHLSPRMRRLDLPPEEIDALVAMMEALDGGNEMDLGSKSFPQ